MVQELTQRKLIGEGQHGQVLKCIHQPLADSPDQRTTVVAVKVFKTPSADSHMYCGRELRMMASSQHPNITKVPRKTLCTALQP